MLTIAICEDDPDTSQRIQALVNRFRENHPDLATPEVFLSSAGLLERIERGNSFDIYLLDIVMPGFTGVEAARRLREKSPDCVIIFLTLSQDFALDAYRVGALQYLLKPVDPLALFTVLETAVELLGKREKKTIFVSTIRGRENLPLSDLVYVECRNHILTYHLADGTVLPGRTIRSSFEVVMAPLLGERNFIHPHKSFIINADFIQRLTPQAFTMTDGAQIPITKSRYATAKSKYIQYFDVTPGL